MLARLRGALPSPLPLIRWFDLAHVRDLFLWGKTNGHALRVAKAEGLSEGVVESQVRHLLEPRFERPTFWSPWVLLPGRALSLAS